MANMIRINEMETNISVLKDAIGEWLHALTSEIAEAGARRVSPVSTKNAVLELYMGRLLVMGSVAVMALYVAEAVNWPAVAVNLLFKVVSWL